MQGKEFNTGFSTEVQWLGLSTVLKTVSFQQYNDQRHVKYVKINQSRQLALDGVVDTDMDYTSNDTGLSYTYYLLFSFVFFLLLFTTLRCKNLIVYLEWRRQSDFEVSIQVTTHPNSLGRLGTRLPNSYILRWNFSRLIHDPNRMCTIDRDSNWKWICLSFIHNCVT